MSNDQQITEQSTPADDTTVKYIQIGETVKVTQSHRCLLGKTGSVFHVAVIFGTLVFVVRIDGKYELLWQYQIEKLENV